MKVAGRVGVRFGILMEALGGMLRSHMHELHAWGMNREWMSEKWVWWYAWVRNGLGAWRVERWWDEVVLTVETRAWRTYTLRKSCFKHTDEPRLQYYPVNGPQMITERKQSRLMAWWWIPCSLIFYWAHTKARYQRLHNCKAHGCHEV